MLLASAGSGGPHGPSTTGAPGDDAEVTRSNVPGGARQGAPRAHDAAGYGARGSPARVREDARGRADGTQGRAPEEGNHEVVTATVATDGAPHRRGRMDVAGEEIAP